MQKFFIIFFLFPLLGANCIPHINFAEESKYRDPRGFYQLVLPRDKWQLLEWKGVDFVLWDPKDGATIVVDVSPLEERIDLATLSRHLLIAFERKQIISQEATKVDGRDAVKTVVEGEVERTALTAESYVVMGDGVFYDIIFWAPREAFPGKIETFHQFLLGVNFLQAKGTR